MSRDQESCCFCGFSELYEDDFIDFYTPMVVLDIVITVRRSICGKCHSSRIAPFARDWINSKRSGIRVATV